jgi:sterol desaturase/sphingolipid hydroxylase (fatty acid hydroxylase superfamily)
MLEFPLQTLGVSFPLLLEKENEKKISLFIYALIFITVRNVMEHDRRFAWLVGNHHLLHHQYPNHNFGEAWIDYTFGTNYYKNT